MDNLVQLIDRLESEPYYFVGTYWAAARSINHPLPFEFDCEFTREDNAILVDGTYRPHSGGPQHPFQVRIPFEDALRYVTSVQMETPALGKFTGRLFFMPGHVTFLARTASAALSAELTASDRGVLTLSGAVDIEGRAFGYSLKGAVTSDRATLSNVVGLKRPR